MSWKTTPPVLPPEKKEKDESRFRVTVGPIPESTPFPSFGKPVIRGAFSLDSTRNYVEGPSALQFLQLPKSSRVHFDLNKLTLQVGPKDPNEEQLMHQQTNEMTHLIDWIHRHEESFRRRRPDFVFYRGLMTKLLGTPYENRDGWRLGAIMKNGTIYLRNIDTQESIESRLKQSQDPKQSRTCSWGFNFEQFLLSDQPLAKPQPNVLRKEECNVVFQTKLGSHELLYAAEIDGVWLPEGNDMNPKDDPNILKNCRLVELKTTRMFPNGQITPNFRRFNMRKWWSQTFTTGISHVVVGFRDDEGVVHELKLYPVEFLAKEGMRWSSTVCFNFLDKFLAEVKKAVNGDGDSVFIFDYSPSVANRENKITLNVTVEKLSSSVLGLSNLL